MISHIVGSYIRAFTRNGLGCAFCCLLLFVAACDVKVGVQAQNNRSYSIRGVKYLVPWETSSHQESPNSFKYTGDSLSFTDSGGTLTVNGKNYGVVKAGDTVDLTTTGKVLVNGTERATQ